MEGDEKNKRTKRQTGKIIAIIEYRSCTGNRTTCRTHKTIKQHSHHQTKHLWGHSSQPKNSLEKSQQDYPEAYMRQNIDSP